MLSATVVISTLRINVARITISASWVSGYIVISENKKKQNKKNGYFSFTKRFSRYHFNDLNEIF